MRERFTAAYVTNTAPWVIGEPQPAIVELEKTGVLGGRILDIGCGLGEHTILLTRLGYDVLGIDYVAEAIARARVNAEEKGIDARFEVADALDLGADPGYDTIVDSALFHIFDDVDRTRYVAGLHRACRPGGLVHVLALSDSGRGFGPSVGEQTIRTAFGAGWALEALDASTYRGVVGQRHAEPLGLPVGTVVDEPAWLARVRRR
ncbi:class I SAM-dependent methyltransferase [Mycolicibacterium fluoranthenivorans]|uniref:Class I SAM-dependent methyltransferase n=1 Tax=Mycolicibacterium fluoranthenivorans TaxID=258505 RepID=A0A7G8PLJ8_9MYCO|nr:class I SAM-dependent methyltransferase [Mycolicibacterium fluoranthenivorans]QNJ95214.1 class I SAM-dependent methyltransferase [Mycolicibacterium fluoranthenivorans]